MSALRTSEAGFSLIEALVAMAILATGAVSMLSSVETHAARITAISERVAARWVAENRLALLRLGAAEDAGEVVTMMGQDWRLRLDWSDTGEPGLARVDIAVARADISASAPGGDADAALVRLTGFAPPEGAEGRP